MCNNIVLCSVKGLADWREGGQLSEAFLKMKRILLLSFTLLTSLIVKRHVKQHFELSKWNNVINELWVWLCIGPEAMAGQGERFLYPFVSINRPTKKTKVELKPKLCIETLNLKGSPGLPNLINKMFHWVCKRNYQLFCRKSLLL